ncbi:MAG: hypothetical protein PSN34_05700 [Urechidicola sp.]|nr:hypothetical protein [Urechidicola sp.]
MFSKTNLISTIVATLWAYFGGFLVWVIIATPLMEGHEGTATGVWKEVPDHLHLVIGCLIFAFAFSTIYSKLAGGFTISSGVQFGLWVGIMLGFGEGIINLGVANFSDLTGTIISGVLSIVFYVIMGALVGLIYNKLSV